jgi:hypothetical protein
MATGDGQVFQIPNKTKAVFVLDKTAFVGKSPTDCTFVPKNSPLTPQRRPSNQLASVVCSSLPMSCLKSEGSSKRYDTCFSKLRGDH